ncbi:MAG: cysteine--tRNA ligase, partial [Chthoniobacterales bacterium]|nr:cysteine--tRNA ligase [Chthoniobacterales bacterium]
MPVSLFNTATRAAEPFRSLDPAGRRVKMYTCGPTVYNYAHIGNFRAYIFEDLLQRHLEARGFQVDRVMNLTDVDDKTIAGCRKANVPLAEFTARFKTAFFEDLAALRIKPADPYPAATALEHSARMLSMIQTLQAQDIAYQAEDGSVYFRIARFPKYGCLAHLNLEELRPSGRIQNDEYEKESIGDFALWKAWQEEDGDVFWESPWGRGRPGWHIECSAMATAILGPQLDIHCGGVDNIFPHHEAEIAQSECVTGLQFARYWLHCAHLMVDGQKMSKSAGNFYTLRDLLERGYSGREIRYALLTVHYRLPLNFTLPGLDAARAALSRLDAWVERLATYSAGAIPAVADPAAMTPAEDFLCALDDDLNISGALGRLFDWLRDSNRGMDSGELSPAGAARALADFERLNTVLALAP